MTYGWTHPICDDCWDREHPFRTPVRINDREVEMCCLCGADTGSGIYIRSNPEHVLYPALKV